MKEQRQRKGSNGTASQDEQFTCSGSPRKGSGKAAKDRGRLEKVYLQRVGLSRLGLELRLPRSETHCGGKAL